MKLRRIIGLCVLVLGVNGSGAAAVDATLADAVEQRDHARIKALLNTGVDVDVPQVDGMTALHWAVFQDDVKMVRALVHEGAKVEVSNLYGVSPLSVAATNGNAEIIKTLLEAGADANASLRGGETVLMTAARTGSLAAVDALITAGADVNVVESRGQTALMWAAAEGHSAVVDALVAADADVHAKLSSGFSPLFFAVREGHIDVVRVLLGKGLDVNGVLERVKDGPDVTQNNATSRPVDDGVSPLIMAVRNGHFELAVELIKEGADPNDRRSGFSPLHTISWVRKPDESDRGDPAPIGSGNLTSLAFVRALVALGADPNLRLHEDAPRQPNSASSLGSGGATPFLLAADRADATLMKQLLDLGADPFLANFEGSTPLMAAAGLGTSAPEEEAGTEPEALIATNFLLDLAADVDMVNEVGDTAMHGAAYGNFPTVVQLLSDYGADIQVWNQKNEKGRTPLFIAEGFRDGLPRQSLATIDAITILMDGAGVSTAGERPVHRDQYVRVPEPPRQR